MTAQTRTPIHRIAGTIYVSGVPVSLAEALILREVTIDEFIAARRAGDADALRAASDLEHALRNALYDASRWRRAAGWADPSEADRVRLGSGV